MGARLVLASVLRCLDAQDFNRPALVRKSVLTQVCGTSLRSVYRYLNELEGKGWIDRAEQHISRKEGSLIAEIQLTQQAIAYLQQQEHSQDSGASLDQLSCDKLAHACKYSFKQYLHRQPSGSVDNSTKPQLEQSNFPTTPPASPQPQPKPNTLRKVPQDCRALLPFLSAYAIFKLMKLATQKGKRLGDIVQYVQQSLLRIRYPYAYLLKLIQHDTDYAALVKSREEKARKSLQKAQERFAHKVWQDEAKNFYLVNPEALIAVYVEGDTSVLSVWKRSTTNDEWTRVGTSTLSQFGTHCKSWEKTKQLPCPIAKKSPDNTQFKQDAVEIQTTQIQLNQSKPKDSIMAMQHIKQLLNHNRFNFRCQQTQSKRPVSESRVQKQDLHNQRVCKPVLFQGI